MEKTADDRKYASIPLSFRDIWEDADKDFNFRFAKPSKLEMKRLQDTAAKNPAQASRNLILATVHPEEKDALIAALDEYPGMATSYSSTLLKAVGLTADAGN